MSSKDAWNPKQYDKFKAERSQPFFDLMGLLDPVLQAQVMDLGCGTGNLTLELHRFLKAAATTGIDSSDQMLLKAKSFQEQGLQFIKGDIRTWSADQEYDIVFSNAAIQWCPDHPHIFSEIRKALKPGGQIAVQMPMNHDYATHQLALKMNHEEKWSSLVRSQYEQDKRMLSMESYAQMLFHLGFKEQKVFTRVYGHVLESREGVLEWVQGTLLTYFESRLKPDDFLLFKEEFKERLFEILPDEKPFFYPFKRILIWGRL